MTIVQNRPRWRTLASSLALLTVLVMAPVGAIAQDDATTTGSVVSTSRNTLTCRSGRGLYQLFVMERNTRKPPRIPLGCGVRVTSTAGDEPGVRVATQITALENQAGNQGALENRVIPPQVCRIERDIERPARRLHLGVRAGVALDPERLLIGVQTQVGRSSVRTSISGQTLNLLSVK